MGGSMAQSSCISSNKINGSIWRRQQDLVGWVVKVVQTIHGWVAHGGPIGSRVACSTGPQWSNLFSIGSSLIFQCSFIYVQGIFPSLSLSLSLFGSMTENKMQENRSIFHFTLKSILFYSQRENDLRLIGFFNLPKHLQSYKMFSIKCFQSNQMQPYYHNKIYNGVVNML